MIYFVPVFNTLLRLRHLVPPHLPGEWGSGLLTEVIAPQQDPKESTPPFAWKVGRNKIPQPQEGDKTEPVEDRGKEGDKEGRRCQGGGDKS
jgi:hypothetical protein